MIFHSLCRRTLYFGDVNNFIVLEPKCVTSDMIILESIIGSFSMIFFERHFVVGEYEDAAGVFVSFGGECETVRKGDIEIHNSDDGEYTAILKREGRFAFAYGKRVMHLFEKGINLDLEALKIKNREPYNKAVSDNDRYAALYSKGEIRCLFFTDFFRCMR